MPQYTVQASMFEGLFVHSLRTDPDGEFADQLRGVGIDLRDLRASYDISAWTAALDLCWRRQFAGLERFEAWRRLGRQFVEGYFQTVVGRFIAEALPLMNAGRFVQHIPLYVRTGLGGISCEVESTGERSATVMMRGPHEGSAHHLGGVLEICFERMKVAALIEPTSLGGVDSSLKLGWGPRA